MNRFRSQFGLTLIEVLIALAICGIALTAVIKATSQNIRATDHVQEKMIALWVGTEIMNEARLNRLRLATDAGKQQGSTEMLNCRWYWHANKISTPNPHIQKLTVDIFNRETSEDEAPLIHLESFNT